MDIPSSIHTKKISEKRFFIKASEIHNTVNMPQKLDSCNNFAVN